MFLREGKTLLLSREDKALFIEERAVFLRKGKTSFFDERAVFLRGEGVAFKRGQDVIVL